MKSHSDGIYMNPYSFFETNPTRCSPALYVLFTGQFLTFEKSYFCIFSLYIYMELTRARPRQRGSSAAVQRQSLCCYTIKPLVSFWLPQSFFPGMNGAPGPYIRVYRRRDGVVASSKRGVEALKTKILSRSTASWRRWRD